MTDPATNLTSERATLTSFTVDQPKAIAAKADLTKESKRATSLWVWLVIGGGVVALGAGVWGLVRWLRHRSRNNTNLPPADPTPQQGTE